MTEAEYALMKEQLRKEILEDLKITTMPATPKPWTKVHLAYERRTPSIDPHTNYGLKTAFCAIVRHRFGLRNVRDATEDQVTEALSMLSHFLTLAGVTQAERQQ